MNIKKWFRVLRWKLQGKTVYEVIGGPYRGTADLMAGGIGYLLGEHSKHVALYMATTTPYVAHENRTGGWMYERTEVRKL